MAAKSREKLVKAALAEFEANGYFGTDTNRIARAAGFSPQTLYRQFSDKLDIFIAAYEAWLDAEMVAVQELLGIQAPISDVARLLVDHHSRHARFRRSLRYLSTEDDRVRSARADGRKRQLELLKSADPTQDEAQAACGLLTLERLLDAVVENELSDLGLADDQVFPIIEDILTSLMSKQ